jgi:hypothetical protein
MTKRLLPPFGDFPVPCPGQTLTRKQHFGRTGSQRSCFHMNAAPIQGFQPAAVLPPAAGAQSAINRFRLFPRCAIGGWIME